MFSTKIHNISAGSMAAVIICFLCFTSTTSQASIVYTNLSGIALNGSLDIDLDGSGGFSDISILYLDTTFQPISGGTNVSVVTDVQVKGAVWAPFIYDYAPLNVGALIDTSTVGTACQPADKKCGLSLTEWSDGGGIKYAPWENLGQRFLGFSVLLDTQIYYGWIQMSVASYNNRFALTVYDYAYESTPGIGILAGSTGISAVPLPGALFLFGSGLLTLLFGINRSKSSIAELL